MREIEEYGFEAHEDYRSIVSIDYTREKDTSGNVVNPITNQKANQISQTIDEHLSVAKNNPNKNITYDVAVSRIIIEIDDRAVSALFDTSLASEPFFFDFRLAPFDDDEFRDRVEPLFKKRNLTQQGFNWRVPCLKQIIPLSGYDIHGENHEPVFSWDWNNVQTFPLSIGDAQMLTSVLGNMAAYTEVQKSENEKWI